MRDFYFDIRLTCMSVHRVYLRIIQRSIIRKSQKKNQLNTIKKQKKGEHFSRIGNNSRDDVPRCLVKSIIMLLTVSQ